MSNLIGASSPQNVLAGDDTDLNMQMYRVDVELTDLMTGYATPWWPGVGWMNSSDAGDQGIGPLGWGHWFEQPEITRGSLRRFAVTGTARDVTGAAAAGAIVHLFRTSDDAEVDVQTADAYGYFFVTSPYFPDAHYIVAYKAGGGLVPDIMGTSVNTLVGA